MIEVTITICVFKRGKILSFIFTYMYSLVSDKCDSI